MKIFVAVWAFVGLLLMGAVAAAHHSAAVFTK